MNEIKNAIILAAGLGSRLKQLTKKTPKPLLKVNGKPLIEYTLDRLNELNIENIIIIVGYKKKKFLYLEKKYSNVTLINNPDFKVSNNISSVFYAREHLINSLIIEGDLFIVDPNILHKYFVNSHYKAFKTVQTSDWCFKLNNDGFINKFSLGGEDCYQMVGISYWDHHYGVKIKEIIETLYEIKKYQQIYWDQVPLDIKQKYFNIRIENCNAESVYEIDTINDLIRADKTYSKLAKRR
jgi:CTP:phosphocholine cytidylyltransferase-like protein